MEKDAMKRLRDYEGIKNASSKRGQLDGGKH